MTLHKIVGMSMFSYSIGLLLNHKQGLVVLNMSLAVSTFISLANLESCKRVTEIMHLSLLLHMFDYLDVLLRRSSEGLDTF